MSFTRLLAAGRSIMGLKKQPGPYRMSQDNLLPKFAPVPKAAAGSGKKPEPSAPPEEASASETAASRAQPADSGKDQSSALHFSRHSQIESKSFFVRLAMKLGRKSRRERSVPQSAPGRPVQTELSLDSVKVVRNDLTDCDFEVLPAGKPGGARSEAQRHAFGMVWNRLSARLLRQAAMDFNVVQKERGKLLSQTGHGSGGAGGA